MPGQSLPPEHRLCMGPDPRLGRLRLGGVALWPRDRHLFSSVQGPFDVDDCTSRHSINPYSNRESRVLFSTWNLDHV